MARMTNPKERAVNPMQRARAFLSSLFAPTVIVTRTTSRPMTDAEIAAFDRAFAKLNEGFDEIAKALDTITTKGGR